MIRGFKRNRVDAPAVTQVNANDAFDMAVQFEQRNDLPAAEQAYRIADELGHAPAALSLGVLLEENDDLVGAEQAFCRAYERGDATGAFHLAWLLQERGDVAGAEAAYRRAEERGHPAAGANLRVLLGEDAPGPVEIPASAEPVTAEFPASARPRRAGPTPPRPRRGDANRAAHDAPANRAARRGAAVAAAAAEGKASARNGSGAAPRRRSRPRRVLGVALPVVAFAVAFLAGSATKDKEPSPSRLAPAANLSRPSVTVAGVAHVPKPAELSKPGRAHRKPKHKPAAHPPAVVHTVAPARPVFRSPPRRVPPASSTTTTSGSGTGTTSSTSGGTSITSLTSTSGTGTVSGTG
jgi:hypothetical protein